MPELAPPAAGRRGARQPIPSSRLKLEASSACQLRCPSCPTTTGHADAVIGRGFLRLAAFARLVDDNPWIGAIELSNYGEPFLNPDLLAILRHAYNRNVTIDILNGANLNHVRADVLEGLVRYQVAGITCSIDGASAESYRRYRVRGDFARVIANIEAINAWKQALGSARPRLLWQFVAFGHNEHEIPLAEAMARRLGMEFRVKLNWDAAFSPVGDEAAIREATGTGAATRQEFSEKHGRDYAQDICGDLWNSPQVNWDGKLLGCCRNFWGDFGGNAFRDGLLAALDHEKLRYAKAMLSGRAAARRDIPCATCEIYHHRRARQDWLRALPPDAALAGASDAAWDRARAHLAAGRMGDAAAEARITLQLQPGHAGALALLGQAAHRAGRTEAAAYYAALAERATMAAAAS